MKNSLITLLAFTTIACDEEKSVSCGMVPQDTLYSAVTGEIFRISGIPQRITISSEDPDGEAPMSPSTVELVNTKDALVLDGILAIFPDDRFREDGLQCEKTAQTNEGFVATCKINFGDGDSVENEYMFDFGKGVTGLRRTSSPDGLVLRLTSKLGIGYDCFSRSA